MLSAYRGAVILADAFGESRSHQGTMPPNSQKDFILPGKDLNIGGQATRALIIAQVNVDRARQQTQNEMGKDEKGKKVSDQELKISTKSTTASIPHCKTASTASMTSRAQSTI